MEDEIISISDSDEEAVPSTSTSAIKNPSTQKQKPPPIFSSASSMSSGSTISSPSSNLDITTHFGSTSGMTLYKPLGADLIAARQLEKKKLPIMQPFPVVRDVVNKMRSSLGTNDSQLNVLGLAQQYITALKYYQASIVNCPNRCRLLARHIIQTMCLIRDLSRHFFDSPHYSQKICELLAIYIYFELQCAGDFKDSKIKIAERIITNIHLHLENAQSNFVLRIFSFLSNMGKENEIATKVFQRLIPEVTIMAKNEFPDRLFVQYLIVFYHWKEAWNDYEDQQKVVAFANKFMKPKSTIKTNTIYAKHLPCYVRRDDATGYFLTNMVFFNDLRNASILDGIQENGPTLIDLSEDEKIYPIIDLSEITMEKVYPLLDIKIERREVDGAVDLTYDDDSSWIKRLIRRAVVLEVMLPARLIARNEEQVPAVIEVVDSDNEGANRNNAENENANVDENENDDDDDSWAFGLNNEEQPQQQQEMQQPQEQELIAQLNNPAMPAPAVEVAPPPAVAVAPPPAVAVAPPPAVAVAPPPAVAVAPPPPPADEETNSLDEMYNEMNSSIDFFDDSTTESEIEKKKEQKERFDIASKLTDAQARITFDGVVEKELKAMYFQQPSTSKAAALVAAATTEKPAQSKPPTTSNILKPVNQPTLSKIASVGENSTSSKAAVASEKTTSMESVEVPTKGPITTKTAKTSETTNLQKVADRSIEDLEIFSDCISVHKPQSAVVEEDIIPSISNKEPQKKTVTNDNANPTESAIVAVHQEIRASSVDQKLNHSLNKLALDNILKETQAPKEAVTITMEDTLLSSFDSSDESDEDFLGRFQQPPFKTYLRRAHRKSSKKLTTKNNTSSSEDDVNANVEKLTPSESENNTRPESPKLSSKDATNENPNVLFSGKVISLREDENSNGAGGVTPNYLNIPESVEVSKHGSNVVFSMQGRRLSSFPSLKVTTDQGLPDFDAEISMTGEEDSNSQTEETMPKKKTFKKSNIASNMKNKNSSRGADKQPTKAKSVWFAERPQVREIERRNSTSTSSSQQKPSAINAISSTINKISANKQHFASKIFSSLSTKMTTATTSTKTKSIINLSESNKISKSNQLIKNQRITTTESSAATAALKSAQEKGLEKQNVVVPDDDNRTDDVLAAAEILANGIGFPTDDTPVIANLNDLKTPQPIETTPAEPKSPEILEGSKASTCISPTLDFEMSSETANLDSILTESELIEENLLLNEVGVELEISTDFLPNEIAEVMISEDKSCETSKKTELTNELIKENTVTEKFETPKTTEVSIMVPKINASILSWHNKKVELPIENELITEKTVTEKFETQKTTEISIMIPKIKASKETELTNEFINENTVTERFETPKTTEASIMIPKINASILSSHDKKVELPIENELITGKTVTEKFGTPKTTEFSIMIPKIKASILSSHDKKVELPSTNEVLRDILHKTISISIPPEKRIEIPIETEAPIESPNKASPIACQGGTKADTLICVEILHIEELNSISVPNKNSEISKYLKSDIPIRKNIEIPDEKKTKDAKEIDIQSNIIPKPIPPLISSPIPTNIDIPDETKVEIEFVNTQSPMVSLDEKQFETEVAIALPKKEKNSFCSSSENCVVENPIEIVSIDFLNIDRIPIPSPGENRDETPIEFEVPNDFPTTKNPLLSHGQKSTLENPIEIDVRNDFCKKRISMLSPGDSSNCSFTLLEQIDKLLTPTQRSDSVDEFELFRAFSPSNAKRLLGEAGHIPLPLKKRRKLSEYSEENIQYKEEEDCSEPIDLDGVLNLKILPKTNNKQPTIPLVLPCASVKPSILSDIEQKEISYPSEPMLSIAHFEEDEYKEISKELNFNKRQYPSAAPPKYSEVMRDFQPIVAHQQTQFRPPELQQQLVQAPQVRPIPLPLQPAPQQIPTVQTINIGYPMQNPYMGTNNPNKPPAYPTTTIRIDSVPSGSTNNIYPGSQPVNLANVNMDYTGHSHPIQITQTMCTPQSCMYNQRPPPTPTPEHVTKDFDIHSLLNLQNYDLNQTYLNNFLHNRQFNYQAGKSLMNNSFCNQSGCFQQNENMQMLKNHSMSGSQHQCSAHTSRRSIIPKCGLCPACKELVADMIVTYNTEVPQMRSSANSAAQRQQEHKQQQELQQMRRYPTNSSPIPQHQPVFSLQQQPTPTLPKKRGRPRKIVTPPLPTNRVTRSANRANQKKKEEPQNEYYAFNVSENTKISPPAGKKRKYNTKPK